MFPTTTYANNKVVDITERVVFTDNTLKNPYVFYPYDLNEYERPDQFANRYYDDAFYSWLLYLSNNMIDPYYNWYLTYDEFNAFIVAKYGSIESAQSRIKYFRNNWAGTDPISISAYNALAPQAVNFWEPQYGLNGSVISYVRKQEDVIINTNSIVSYTLDTSSNANAFMMDELCTIQFNTNQTGTGQVLFANGNSLYLQHVFGYEVANTLVQFPESYGIKDELNDYITDETSAYIVQEQQYYGPTYIYGHQSGANIGFTAAVTLVNNFDDATAAYFSPVNYYDYENEKNESKKTLNILDSAYAKTVALDIKALLK